MRNALLRLLILAAGSSACGQILDPVHWSLTSDIAKAPPGSTVPLKLTAKLDPGWHLYSLTQPKPGPDGGPITSTAGLAESPALGAFRIFQPPPETKFDPNFKLETQTFEKEVVFWIAADLSKVAPTGLAELTAQFRYQACDDRVRIDSQTSDQDAFDHLMRVIFH
jgi:thiol:disulfide interchange protein DsbD